MRQINPQAKLLRIAIKKKFGTISEFARQSGVNRTELQILFAVKNPNLKFLKRIKILLHSVTPLQPVNHLTTPNLERLREALNKAGGVTQFCRENKGFIKNTVNQIIAGRYKTLSPSVLKLFAHFGL